MLSIMLAMAASGGWVLPDVGRDVARCRFMLEGESNDVYERRKALIVREARLTPEQARDLEERCQIFVLGQGELALWLGSNPR